MVLRDTRPERRVGRQLRHTETRPFLRTAPNHRLSGFIVWLAETGLAGWGGRTRTSEWRNQNPLPYHLAAPHQAAFFAAARVWQDFGRARAGKGIISSLIGVGPRRSCFRWKVGSGAA